MFMLGLATLGSIFISFGCLVAAFRSLASISQAYDRESRITAITGFVGGILISALFAWVTIYLLDRLSEMNEGFSM
jgi:hypothetical protein